MHFQYVECKNKSVYIFIRTLLKSHSIRHNIAALGQPIFCIDSVACEENMVFDFSSLQKAF